MKFLKKFNEKVEYDVEVHPDYVKKAEKSLKDSGVSYKRKGRVFTISSQKAFNVLDKSGIDWWNKND